MSKLKELQKRVKNGEKNISTISVESNTKAEKPYFTQDAISLRRNIIKPIETKIAETKTNTNASSGGTFLTPELEKTAKIKNAELLPVKESRIKTFGKEIKAGLTSFAAAFNKGLDFIIPEEIIPGNPLERYFERSAYTGDYNVNEAIKSEKRSGFNPTAGALIRSTAEAVPQTASAIMTAGASQGASALSTAGNGMLAAIQNLIKNPSYLTSYLGTVGNDFEEAKKSGMDDFRATSYALVNSAINAGVEVGGGLETFFKTKGTGRLKDALFDWAKSASEEGLEEVVQGVVTNINKGLFKGEIPELYSSKNQEAIINPSRMGQEFIGGTVVGGILGSAGSGVNVGINKLNQNAYYENLGAEIVVTDRINEIVEEGLKRPTNSSAYKDAVNMRKLQNNNQENKIKLRQLGKLYYDLNNTQNKNIPNTLERATTETPIVKNNIKPVVNAKDNTDLMKKQPMPEPINDGVRKFGETLGERGRRFLYSEYNGESDFDKYTIGFKGYYDAGAVGIPFEKMQSRVLSSIREVFPDNIAEIVYDLGKKDAQDTDTSIKTNIPNAVYYGEDAGLVKNTLTAGVDKNVVNAMNNAAKAVGTKLNFVETLKEGKANGSYDKGIITIARDAENSAFAVEIHELGHRLKETAPDDYRAISNYVMAEIDNSGGLNFSERIDRYIKAAANENVKLTRDGAIEEITNNYIAEIINTPEKLNALIENAKNGKLDTSKSVQENMNILQRFVEMLKEFVAKIKTKLSKGEISSEVADADIKNAEKAIELIQNAFNTSIENAGKFTDKNKSQEWSTSRGLQSPKLVQSNPDNNNISQENNNVNKDNIKYSIKTDKNGNKYWQVESDKDIFKNEVDKQRLKNLAFDYILRGNKGEVINEIIDGNPLKFTRISAEEYVYGIAGKKLSSDDYKKKMRMAPSITDLIENSTVSYNTPDHKNHKFAKDGFKNYRGRVRIDDVIFDYIVRIGQNNNANMFYDINLEVESILPSTKVRQKYKNDSTSTDNISQKSDIVNKYSMQDLKNDAEEKYSLKSTAELEKEIATLTKKNKSLEGKLKKAEKLISPEKNLDALADTIKNEYDSEIDHDKLYSDLTKLSEMTRNVADKNITYAELKENAVQLAKNILNESVRVNTEMREQYKELRNYLKTTKIFVDEDTKISFDGDYNSFRQKNFGRLGISTKEGVGIDEVYRQLSWDYPDFFNLDAERSSKQRLEQMANVLDSLKPIYENPFSGYMNEAAEWLGNSIIDSLYQQSLFTGSGKAKVEVDFETIHSEASTVVRKIMQREADWHEKQLNKIRSEYSKKWERRTERQKKAQKIRQIRTHFDRLSKMLLKPTERSYIPEFVQQPIAEFLNTIDVRNDKMGGKIREALTELYRTFDAIERNETDETLIVDPDLLANLNIITDSIKVLSIKESDAIEDGKLKLSLLDSNALEALYRAALAIENSVTGYNRIMREGKEVFVSDLGRNIINENVSDDGYTGSANKLKQAGADLLNMDMVAPWDFMHQLGKTTESLYSDIRRGLDTKIRKMRSAKDFMSSLIKGVKVDKISGKKAELKTFELSDGSEIKLTQAQVMSFYLLSKQEAALEHITEGGIKSPPTVVKDGKLQTPKIEETFEPVHLTLEDVIKIRESLPENLRNIADKIGEFFTKQCAEWGNEVSLQMYGYKKFGVKNYFPIVSDKMYINTVFGETTDATLKNMGITKARVKHANNPVIIEDVFDVFTRHVDKMSSYNAFVIPLQNMQRVFNYKGKSNSVKQSIKKKYGNRAIEYFSKLMTDINGNMKYEGGSEITNKLVSNYKSAKMGLNVRVALQQPFSYIRAGVLIDAKYLAASASVKTNLETIYKYAPIAQWKDWGFFSLDTGRSMRDLILDQKHLNDYTMALAGKMDELTWRRIWGAVELEIKDKYKNLTPGTAEFYSKCGERFSEIIDRTQVVDSVFHRANILRSQDGFKKLATSFMSEPIKTYNLYRTAFADYARNKTAENRKKLIRTARWCVLSTLILGTFSTGLYDTATGDDDEEGKIEQLIYKLTGKSDDRVKDYDFLHRWMFNSIDNIFGDLTGMVPYAKDLVSLLQGYDVKRMDMQGFSDLLNAFKRITNDKYTWISKVTTVAAKGADFFGIPASTLRREIGDLLIKNLAIAIDSKILEYNIKKVNYSLKSSDNVGEYVNILYKAFKDKDEEAYEKIYDDMVKNGMPASKIESRLKKMFLEDVNAGTDIKSFDTTFTHVAHTTEEIREGEERFTVDNLSTEQLKKYRDRYVTLENNVSLGWGKHNVTGTQKTAMIEKTVKYAKEIALRDASGGEYVIETKWINDAEQSLKNLKISVDEYIYLTVKYDVTSTTMSSEGMLQAVKSGVSAENYLKFKAVSKEVEKELDEIRKKRKLASGEKRLKIRTAIQKLNIPVEQKKKLDQLYFSE